MSTLPASPVPSQSSTRTTKYRVTRVALGNGYEQRSQDGLNAKVDSWTLVFENITATDLSTMLTFFDGLGGSTYFSWQAPTDSVSKHWITSGDYTLQALAGNIFTLSVPIEQVFDL